MVDLSSKLKEIRKVLGLSQKEMANKLGVSLRAYQHWEYSDREIPLYIIEELIRDFRVNPGWLFLNRGEMFLSAEYERWQDEVLGKSKELRPVDYRYIPIVGYVSAGIPKEGEEEELGWIPIARTKEGELALIVNGTSMEPTIPYGAVVIVKRVYFPDDVSEGDIVLARIDGEHTLKRIYFDHKNNRIILKGDNDKFEPLAFPIGEFNLRIEGKIVGMIKFF